MWRIFESSTHEDAPPVEQLAIHLPSEELVYFEEGPVDDELRQRMNEARSTLMVFFNYNQANQESRRYLYQEFPEHPTLYNNKNTACATHHIPIRISRVSGDNCEGKLILI